MAPQNKLCECLEDTSLSHQERLTIGQYLATLGDPRPGVGVDEGVPDIAWVDIPGSSVKVAKYLVTNAQFQAFIDADDGYNNDEWWVSMRRWPNGPSEGRCIESNAPRENVSWFMAVAFCRWMSHRTRLAIRLPSESEWQQAKDGGNPQFIFPWGLEWDSSRCNLAESKLQRAISVGMYPAGATRQGLLDMVGNVSEWCLNQYKDSGASEAIETHADNAVYTICGGSYDTWILRGARASFRHYERADSGFMGVGFRLAQDIEP
jgi:formylglycine-generating enzyme required for sulfatase activity